MRLRESPHADSAGYVCNMLKGQSSKAYDKKKKSSKVGQPRLTLPPTSDGLAIVGLAPTHLHIKPRFLEITNQW